MTRNYFERRRLRLRARAMAGVAARERKRMTEATSVDVVEVGRVTFDGPAFAVGVHAVRQVSEVPAVDVVGASHLARRRRAAYWL